MDSSQMPRAIFHSVSAKEGSSMIECAICTRHPHDTADDCTPFCIEVPQPKGKAKVLHRHLPDADCTTECRSREADLGRVCGPCAQKIRDDLDTLVDSWAATTDPAFPGGSSGDGRAKSSPLPGGTDWMDWRQGADLFGVLTTWVRDWCDVYALAGPRRGDLTSITGWLRAHLDHAANSHPAIDDFADEIRKLAQRGMRLAGEVPDHGQRVPCPTDDCGRTLRVRTADIDERVRCHKCGIERTAGQLLAIAMLADKWVPAETAADVAGVSARSIRTWGERGHIDRGPDGYWLPSVRQYVAERNAKLQTRRTG